MSDVFLCETGQLTNASKTALRKAGVVVVEVADPSKCQFIRASEVVSHSDMIWAALDALNLDDGYGKTGSAQREQMVANLLTVVLAARQGDRTPAP